MSGTMYDLLSVVARNTIWDRILVKHYVSVCSVQHCSIAYLNFVKSVIKFVSILLPLLSLPASLGTR
jgi:hypothetical protein